MPRSDSTEGNGRVGAQTELKRPISPGRALESSADADQEEIYQSWGSLLGSDFGQATFDRHAALLGDSRMSNPMYSRQKASIIQQLQRDYGNRYVQRLVQRAGLGVQRKPPGPDAPQEIPEDIYTHPEWPIFYQALVPIISRGEVEGLWRLTMEGIKLQEQMNEEGRKRDENRYYTQLAEEAHALLTVDEGKKMALWSGGYAVSEYAQAKDYITLEATTAGRIYDALQLYKDWKTITPLWNHISREFVNQAQPGEVHIFMRVFAPDSVLFREEVVGLMERAQHLGVNQISLQWHILYGEQELLELAPDGNLVADHPFPNPDAAVKALMLFMEESADFWEGFTQVPPEHLIPWDNRAFQEMRQMLDRPEEAAQR